MCVSTVNICIFDQCQTVFLQGYAIHTTRDSAQFTPHLKMQYLLVSFGLSHLVNRKNKNTHTTTNVAWKKHLQIYHWWIMV